MTRYMGIDLGTRKVSMALIGPMVGGDQMLMACDTFESHSEIRDEQMYTCTRWLYDTCRFYEPDYVWVEAAISGRNVHHSLQLAQMEGAVLSALSMLRPRTDVRSVDNKQWKKLIVGNGNATKDQVRNYIQVTHPPYALLCGDRQDEYDAACIALAGIRLTEQASVAGLLVGQDEPADA